MLFVKNTEHNKSSKAENKGFFRKTIKNKWYIVLAAILLLFCILVISPTVEYYFCYYFMLYDAVEYNDATYYSMFSTSEHVPRLSFSDGTTIDVHLVINGKTRYDHTEQGFVFETEGEPGMFIYFDSRYFTKDKSLAEKTSEHLGLNE